MGSKAAATGASAASAVGVTRVEDLSGYIQSTEAFNVKTGGGALGPLTAYDAPLMVRVTFKKRVKLSNVRIDAPAQHGTEVYLFADCGADFDLSSAENGAEDPKKPYHSRFALEKAGGVHVQSIRVKDKEAALIERGFTTLGIYIKELDE